MPRSSKLGTFLLRSSRRRITEKMPQVGSLHLGLHVADCAPEVSCQLVHITAGRHMLADEEYPVLYPLKDKIDMTVLSKLVPPLRLSSTG